MTFSSKEFENLAKRRIGHCRRVQQESFLFGPDLGLPSPVMEFHGQQPDYIDAAPRHFRAGTWVFPL